MNIIKDRNSEIYDFSDPRKVGPGSWFMFHLSAAHAETSAEKQFFCKQVRLFCQYFKCGQCQNHCKEYIKNNPPSNSLEDLFKWTVDFRNAVNLRLERWQYDIDIMRDLFYQEDFKVCYDGCGQKTQGSDSYNQDFIEINVSDANKYKDLFYNPNNKSSVYNYKRRY